MRSKRSLKSLDSDYSDQEDEASESDTASIPIAKKRTKDSTIITAELNFQRAPSKSQFLANTQAIAQIIREKSYKSKSASIRAYFQTYHGISRAQVYRYRDSALILDKLNEVDGYVDALSGILPWRERLCRTLKKCARGNGKLMRELWRRVVELNGATQQGLQGITSASIERVWTEMNAANESSEECKEGGAFVKLDARPIATSKAETMIESAYDLSKCDLLLNIAFHAPIIQHPSDLLSILVEAAGMIGAD